MSFLNISDADEVYECSGRCTIERHRISHELLHQYCVSVAEIGQLAEELDTEGTWTPILRSLKRLRFDLNAIPAAFSEILESNAQTYSDTKRRLELAARTYPDMAEATKTVISQLEEFANSADSPLLDTVIDVSSISDAALLIKEARSRPIVKHSIEAMQADANLPLVDCQELRRHARFKELIVAGPTRWFPDFVFSAPRVNRVHVVHFKDIIDKWAPPPVFQGLIDSTDQGPDRTCRRGRVPSETTVLVDLGTDLFDATEILPRIDWGEMTNRVQADSHQSAEETVIANLFILEGGKAVLLDADDNAKASVVDLEEFGESRVHRIPVGDIEPNMFVVLRVGRGGDYVVDVANQLMGNHAAHARVDQRRWKKQLKELADTVGVAEVVCRLERAGATLANPQNVRNWMSLRKIKPQARDDFVAIMRLINLESESDDLWTTMSQIDKAHKKAGQIIRKQLIKQIQECDVQQLQRSGQLDFSLPGVVGGMSAIRVTETYPEMIEVPASRIGQLEDVLWQ